MKLPRERIGEKKRGRELHEVTLEEESADNNNLHRGIE
jgi:hypothetical protein